MQGLSLAPELLVQCDQTNNGCGGGRLDDAWTYLKEHGIPKVGVLEGVGFHGVILGMDFFCVFLIGKSMA